MEEIQEILHSILSATQQKGIDLIDVDIMMEEVRMLYSRLQVLRTNIAGNDQAMMQEKPASQTIAYSPAKPAETPAPVQQPVAEPETEQEYTVPEPLEHYIAPLNADTEIKNVWIHPASAIKIISQNNEPRDIRKLIGINDKYQLISELFHNNKEAYEDVMTELNSFETFKQATDWINLFIHDQYRWDDDSQAVLILYNILSKFLPDR